MKTAFSTRPPASQSGYALILMVLALMGLGGVVLTGFTRGAIEQSEHERYLHNQRVLQEAKQALLQYAYNYPVTMGNGPGRLPCPDLDAPGNPPYVPHPAGFGISEGGAPGCQSGGALVGRLPWRDPNLNFYEAKDASGEHLWFAVTKNFSNQGNFKINSGTLGGITIRDRSGAILHDSSIGGGVAAVIIAPGPPIARGGVLQVRSDNAERVNPVNYLDVFDGEDNANFVNTNPNGFVTGPVRDVVTGDLLVNDQMIIITADELVEVAEKATLQAYRTAINDYLALTGGVYPWLYNYEGIEYDIGAGESVNVAIDKLSSFFPAHANFADEDDYLGLDTSGGDDGIFGRIPSAFGNYFGEASTQSIESRFVQSSISLINPALSDTYTLTEVFCEDGCPQGTGGVQTFAPDLIDGGPRLEFSTVQVLTDVAFIDIEPDVVGDDGILTATFPVPESHSFEVYFWDEDNSPTGVWTACPAGADELLDCSRASDGTPTPGAANDLKARILHLTVTLDFSGVEDFEFDYEPGAPVMAVVAADAGSHAAITATYAADNIISFPGTLSATYEFEQHWHAGDAALDPSNNTYTTGTVDMSGFTLGSLTLGVRYFPEIPDWAFQNEWHDRIRMAYALEYKPPGVGPCIVDVTCLQLDDTPGTPRDKVSLLVIGGQGEWVDGDPTATVPVAANGELKDELRDVFDEGNHNNNPTFYLHRGDDKLLVIDEL